MLHTLLAEFDSSRIHCRPACQIALLNLIFEKRWNLESAAAAFWSGNDLMAPKLGPLPGGLDVFVGSPDNFILALGNPN